MRDLQTAERYARALLELALERGEDHPIEDALVALAAALKGTPELERFLANPNVERRERARIVKAIFRDEKGGETFASFIELLFKNGRFGLLEDIATVYKRISDEAQGQATVVIRSAAPLSSEDERRITGGIEKIGGFKAEVRKEVDPALIGGVVVRFKNKVIDGSVKNRIALIKRELTEKRTV